MSRRATRGGGMRDSPGRHAGLAAGRRGGELGVQVGGPGMVAVAFQHHGRGLVQAIGQSSRAAIGPPPSPPPTPAAAPAAGGPAVTAPGGGALHGQLPDERAAQVHGREHGVDGQLGAAVEERHVVWPGAQVAGRPVRPRVGGHPSGAGAQHPHRGGDQQVGQQERRAADPPGAVRHRESHGISWVRPHGTRHSVVAVTRSGNGFHQDLRLPGPVQRKVRSLSRNAPRAWSAR